MMIETLKRFVEDVFDVLAHNDKFDWSDECVEEELTEGYKEREFLENGKEFIYAVA